MDIFQPVVARTQAVHRPVTQVAYDCVKVIVVRDGSAVLFSEFGEQPVSPGDVVLLGANVLCGSEPEGHITMTTLYLDTDYVVDQFSVARPRVRRRRTGSVLHPSPEQAERRGCV